MLGALPVASPSGSTLECAQESSLSVLRALQILTTLSSLWLVHSRLTSASLFPVSLFGPFGSAAQRANSVWSLAFPLQCSIAVPCLHACASVVGSLFCFLKQLPLHYRATLCVTVSPLTDTWVLSSLENYKQNCWKQVSLQMLSLE